MKFKHQFAYTLAEIMISLAIISLIMGVISTKVLKQSPDLDKTRVKKAYISIEQTVRSMLNDSVLYPDDDMLKNLTPVTTTLGDQFGVRDKNTKFRDSFIYYLTVAKEDIPCSIYTGKDIVEAVNNCFKTTDGVVYGIPNTNLTSVGVIGYKGTRSGAKEHKYVPITVYPNFDKKNNVETDTMLVGVRFDGKIQILNNQAGCSDESTDINCNVSKFLHSDTVKRERH